MSQRQKLLSHLKSNPKDFTFDEAESLLKTFASQAAPRKHTA